MMWTLGVDDAASTTGLEKSLRGSQEAWLERFLLSSRGFTLICRRVAAAVRAVHGQQLLSQQRLSRRGSLGGRVPAPQGPCTCNAFGFAAVRASTVCRTPVTAPGAFPLEVKKTKDRIKSQGGAAKPKTLINRFTTVKLRYTLQ